MTLAILSASIPQIPGIPSVTGLTLCLRLNIPCVPVSQPNQVDCYFPQRRLIILSYQTAHSDDRLSLLRTAHEIAHYYQHRERPVLFWWRWFTPVKVWLEDDAWRSAQRILERQGLA